ncbi:MAG TPA: glycosyltransferase family 2 protein [Paludibacteraceae bacterium]|nr:glycosyltransferase family 2 protein [Paludibacteraceae bacterium]HOL00257.1 glycosyltransferase family 2 protein [Paludibacteraceae bacterium]HPO67164.1 glycosyltransferase family 2 protein [Paludibacteraceae bacterium]
MYQSLSIIVPCYNEEEVIIESYKRLKQVSQKLDFDTDIIFINDGSIDRTEQILSEIAKTDKNVKVISFSRNFGHQNAVTAGLNHCTSDLAVIIDADLQDPPELIPQMIETLKKNQAQVVYCVRKIRKGESLFKRFSAKIFYRFLNFLSEIKLPVDTGDFRLVDKNIIKEFNRMREKGKYIRGLIAWMGFKQVPFYYEREARFAGETKYSLSKMIKLATTSMLYFSKKPLKIAIYLGFFTTLLAILLVLWSIFGKIFGFTNADPGWTSLFIAIVFFGGIQLLTIGILGTYIGTLFDEVKDRPEYVVKNLLNFENNIEKEK